MTQDVDLGFILLTFDIPVYFIHSYIYIVYWECIQCSHKINRDSMVSTLFLYMHSYCFIMHVTYNDIMRIG